MGEASPRPLLTPTLTRTLTLTLTLTLCIKACGLGERLSYYQRSLRAAACRNTSRLYYTFDGQAAPTPTPDPYPHPTPTTTPTPTPTTTPNPTPTPKPNPTPTPTQLTTELRFAGLGRHGATPPRSPPLEPLHAG